MKRIPFLLLSVVALVLIFSGCKKKDTEPAYYMNAVVDNTECDVSDCIVFTSGTSTIIKGFLKSATVPYTYIALSIQKTTLLPAKIEFANVPGSYANVFNAGGSTSFAQSGTVTILEVSGTTVSGTFSFTCTDGTVVTDGGFSAKRM